MTIQSIINAYSDAEKSTYQRIAEASGKIFDFDYPHRNLTEVENKHLQMKILRHYYFREIGVETVGKWKFYLESRMNEIMPYYDEMYRSAKLEYDILTNVKMENVYAGKDVNKINRSDTLSENISENTANTGTVKNKNTETHSGSEHHLNSVITDLNDKKNETRESTKNEMETRKLNVATETLNSDFPQSVAANVDYGSEYQKQNTADTGKVKHNGSDTGKYITNNNQTQNVSDSGNTTTNNNSSLNSERTDALNQKVTGNTTRNNEGIENADLAKNYTLTQKGNNGSSFPELIQKYREVIVNIDMMIISDLSDLFMNIY